MNTSTIVLEELRNEKMLEISKTTIQVIDANFNFLSYEQF